MLVFLLGAAIFGAVVAGAAAGGYDSVEAAQAKMCGLKPTVYKPDAKRHEVYNQIFKLYRQLHDAFGTTTYHESLCNVMKDLLAVRDKARGIA